MTTEENNNDAKKGAGYLKEKFLIGLTRFTNDEVERAIMKVTSHMLKAPNEKHMSRLIQATQGHFNTGSVDHGDVNRYIIEELEKRSHTHNWIVVLKTYVALHRLMSEGSKDIQRVMQGRMGLFSVRNIKDVADSPEGAAAKNFIEQYIRYLEERNIVQFKLADHGVGYKLEAEEFLTATSAIPLEQLPTVFELQLSMLEALVLIEFRATIVDNFLTHEAYRKVVGDGRCLYKVLSNRVLAVLDRFDDMTLPVKEKWLKLYRRFDKAVKSLGRLFDQMNSANVHWGENIPTLKMLPESILKRMEDDVKFSTVPAEDLSAVLGSLSVAVDRGPTVGADRPSTSDEAPPVPQTVVKGESPASTSLFGQQPSVAPSATAPQHDAMDDLFGSPLKPVKAAPVASVAQRVEPSPAVSVSTRPADPFVWSEPEKPSASVPPSVAPSAATRAPAPAAIVDFDPFAPVAAPAPAAQTSSVDFFSNSVTPQQQYARAHQTSPGPSASPAPFSELAAQGRSRAW